MTRSTATAALLLFGPLSICVLHASRTQAFLASRTNSVPPASSVLGRTSNLASFASSGIEETSSKSVRDAATTPPSWDELSKALDDLADDDAPKPCVTLYRDTNGWCPFCERVWVALRAKGITYQEQLISLQNKPDWYKALVPTTLVPAVLFHANGDINERRIVWESADIMHALDKEFPDAPQLMLNNSAEFDEALQMNEDLQTAGFAFVYGGRNDTLTEKDKLERCDNFLAQLDRLDTALQKVQKDCVGRGNVFRLGKEFTGADAIMVPTLERWRYQLPITADVDILEGRPGLEKWFEAMDSFAPYADRVAGDEYSWTATTSMFLRYFGGGEDKPDVSAAIRRADDAAERLAGSFVGVASKDENGKYSREAATKLIANHKAVVKDCTRSDPKSQQHIERASDFDAADVMLRHAASLLLDCSCGNCEAVTLANEVSAFDMTTESGIEAAAAARIVASRLCVPRDMSAPAASILRAVLASFSNRLDQS